MEDSSRSYWKTKFSLEKMRVLKDAAQDPAYKYLKPTSDLPMLLAFLERFDHLGWLPPLTPEKQQLLEEFGIIMHETEEGCFYEFCSQGARGEREPWLTIFFHVAWADRSVRLCGIFTNRELIGRARRKALDFVGNRVDKLEIWLKHS